MNIPDMPRTPLQSTPCKGCAKPIYFVKDTEGTTQVLDAVPPIFVQIRDVDGNPMVMRVKGFVSHFATCPKAKEKPQ